MCGICGYLSYQTYRSEILEKMNNTMYRRGPDDAGTYQSLTKSGRQLGLGQRRLSILDLSSAGHQPMSTGDGRYIIVYNGEVYNFLELREDLQKKGVSFHSECDTEVILKLYTDCGDETFAKLNGMFAIAIYDTLTDELVLARDRFGKKPLYYYAPKGGRVFAFASELKPLMQFPEYRKEIRTELISSYLVHKYIPAPDTLLQDTYKVEPGQWLKISATGITKGKYWDVVDRFAGCSAEPVEDYDKAKRELKDLLLDAVSKRLIADVPVGTFLSGGIDSTLVTALAGEESEEPVRTYSIGFFEKEKNEAEFAKAVADHLGTKHTERYVTHEDLFEQLESLTKYYDEPFADSSQLPTMLVSKFARQGETVALTGDGGDEIFGGYEKYDWMRLVQRFDKAGAAAYAVANAPLIEKLKLQNHLSDKAYGLVNNRDANTKLQCFDDVRERYTAKMVVGESLSAKHPDYESRIHQLSGIKNDWVAQNMLFDTRYYMTEVLQKVDRGSMKYSLECRCPLLDYRVVEYSYRLPNAYKYANGQKKRILKDILYDYVPRELIDRPKRGFGVPLAKWLRNELNEQLLRFADKDILKRQEIFVPERIEEFLNRLMKEDKSVNDSVLWCFFVFQMWYREYVEDLWG